VAGNKKATSPADKRYQERRKAGLAKANKDKRIKAHARFVERKQQEKANVGH
jgi:hypothetical protein